MITISRTQIRFKDGSVWEKGTMVEITVNRMTPHIAQLALPGDETPPRKVRSMNLYIWFDEFIEITEDVIQEAVMDGTCPSLLGDDVEPDGWDSAGFPSAMLAYGII